MALFEDIREDDCDDWGPDPNVLPDVVDDLPTDWFLAAVIAEFDRARMSHADLIRLLRAEDRLVKLFQARAAQTRRRRRPAG